MRSQVTDFDGKRSTSFKGHTEAAGITAFSLDGARLASASNDCTVRLWNVETRREISSVSKRHAKSAKSVVFCLSGARIGSSLGDWTVRLELL